MCGRLRTIFSSPRKGGGARQSVGILCAAPIARSVLGDDAVVEETDDGSAVVELEVSNVDGFRSFVLGFVEHAEVVSPPELREAVVTWLAAVAL